MFIYPIFHLHNHIFTHSNHLKPNPNILIHQLPNFYPPPIPNQINPHTPLTYPQSNPSKPIQPPHLSSQHINNHPNINTLHPPLLPNIFPKLTPPFSTTL